jgi:hypothetical protein
MVVHDFLLDHIFSQSWRHDIIMLPDQEEMEGCPESNALLYLILSSLLLPFLFALWKLIQAAYANLRQMKMTSSQPE